MGDVVHVSDAVREWFESLSPDAQERFRRARDEEETTHSTGVVVKVFLTRIHDGSAPDKDLANEAAKDVEDALQRANVFTSKVGATFGSPSDPRGSSWILDCTEGEVG